MRRTRIPQFLLDLDREPGAVRTLLVGCLALVAAGLEPRVFSPGLGSVQAAVRARPDVEMLLLMAALLATGLLLVGGVLGDTDGRRRIQLGALAVLIVTDLSGLAFDEGPLFLAGRLFGVAAASVIVPFAIAGVATRYQGIPRATAIGLAYAAYGAATAANPVLLTLFGPSGPRWPAFVAAALAATIALVAAWSRWPDLPGHATAHRRTVLSTAVWAFGVIVLAMGVIGSGHGIGDPLRLPLIVVGLALTLIPFLSDRIRRDRSGTSVHIERRPVAVALFVGLVIAFAQAAPLLQLPLFFQLVAGYGTLVATLATLPFVAALIVAGPIAGVLLSRVGPRGLIAGGVAAVGLGNLLLSVALGPAADYVGYLLPLLLIGAGFVIATTVRTAIIFASVPRGLPATAAALNEASVALGTRAGLVIVTLAVSRLAIDAYAASLGGADATAASAAVAAFRDLLVAIGTPGYASLVGGVGPEDGVLYAAAYTEAVRVTFAVTGAATLLAAGVAWLAIGRRDPLTTVWEHREERAPEPAAVS